MTPRTRCAASKQTGQIRWQGELVFVSEAVRGELVGLAETERGDWTVRFMQRGTGAHRSPDAPLYARVARPADRMRRGADAAVEMPLLWKSQNDFHRSLEISPQNARFPHSHKLILVLDVTKKSRTEPERKCYPCIRSNLLPMFPVAHR